MRAPRLRSAPLLDLACLSTFVLIGGREHKMTEGVGWFLHVMWPLCAGFFGVALLTRVYTRTRGVWRWLAITLLGGIALAQVLRGSFQGRPWVSLFLVIALAYLSLTMYGWRLVVLLVTRGRRAPATEERVRRPARG